MKKIYISILFTAICSVSVQAQLTLTKAAKEPVAGDMKRMRNYDSTTVVPKNTGAGQSWNFTSLTLNTFTETTTFTTVASAPGGSLFPTASVAATRGGEYEFWRSNSTSFEYVGNHDMTGPVTTTFSNGAIFYNWPISITNTNSDTFSGLETAPTGTTSWSGAISYTATGAGTVTLPGGNVHTNCLQVTRTITLTMTSGTTVTTYNERMMEYFSSSTKFPIIEIQYSTVTFGTSTTKDASIYVNIDALTVGINEQNVSGSNFIIYPNPASNAVNVFLPNNEIASSIEIIDVTGKLVASTFDANTINVSTLAKAVYTIRVRTKDSVLQRSLAITE